MSLAKIAPFFLMGILTVSLLGCGQAKDKAENREKTDSSLSAGSRENLAISSADMERPGNVLVAITPKPATVKDDLRAMSRGAVEIRSYFWERNGFPVQGALTDILTRDNFQRGDEITVVLETEKGTARASVSIENSRPQVLAVPFLDPQIRHGHDIEVKPEAVDADGDPVSFRFSWAINGVPLSLNDSPRLSGDLFRKGDRISLTVVPFDGTDEGYPFIGLDFVVPNAPPAFVSNPPTAFLGDQYIYEALAIDPDGDELRYSLLSAPPGMTIHQEAGKISWQIGQADVGEHLIQIVAEDADGMKAQQDYSVRIGIETGAGGK